MTTMGAKVVNPVHEAREQEAIWCRKRILLIFHAVLVQAIADLDPEIVGSHKDLRPMIRERARLWFLGRSPGGARWTFSARSCCDILKIPYFPLLRWLRGHLCPAFKGRAPLPPLNFRKSTRGTRDNKDRPNYYGKAGRERLFR